MGLLLTSLLLIVSACALAILRVFRPRLRSYWLLSLGASGAAVLSTFAWRAQLPIGLRFPLWRSAVSSNSFASFTVQATTWPYILGLTSLVFGLVLAAPGRPRFPAPKTWMACLAIAGLGVLALAADSALTLVLFWAAIDLAEAALLLAGTERRVLAQRAPYAFSLKLASTGLVLLALVLGGTGATSTAFADADAPAVLRLLEMAALLRLVSLGFSWPAEANSSGPDDIGGTLQFAGGVAALGFLSQLPSVDRTDFLILAACAVVALLSGWMYLRAPTPRLARPFWIIGIGSFAVASSARGNPVAAAAWGCSMLLAGGALLTAYGDNPGAKRIPVIGLWIVSALPFSLSSSGWLGGGSWIWSLPLFLAAEALLVSGYIQMASQRHAETHTPRQTFALNGIQYAAFAWPVGVGVLLGIWGWPGALQFGSPAIGVTLIVVVGGVLWAKQRIPVLSPSRQDWLPSLIRSGAQAVRYTLTLAEGGLRRLTNVVASTLEGEAGIMWGLLFLVLLISIVARSRR